MKFRMIVAMDQNRGIGIENKLPWHLSADLKYFKKITTATKKEGSKNAVIMGRKTWESIPKKFRPLPGRLNIVLSRNADYMVIEGIELVRAFTDAIDRAKELNAETSFVIGGAQVFEMALEHPDCEYIYVTEILETFECDTHLSKINNKQFERVRESEIMEENGMKFRFVEYAAV